MINPSREIYEMGFRQQDLARKYENHRRVKLAMGRRTGVAERLLGNVGHFLRQLLSRQRRPRRDASVDLKQPFLDRLG